MNKDWTESTNIWPEKKVSEKVNVLAMKGNKLGKTGWGKGRKGLDQSEGEEADLK